MLEGGGVTGKVMTLDLNPTPHTAIGSKGIIDVNAQHKSITLSGQKQTTTKDKIFSVEAKEFLDLTPKAQSQEQIDKFDLIYLYLVKDPC